MTKFRNSLLFFVILSIITACESRGNYVLDNDDMEDVLYDIHKSHFLFEDDIERRYNAACQYALTQHILKQHDVTKQQWDSSLVYYTRNADQLERIYERLSERLELEATAMGAGISEVSDSTDIWMADRNIILTTDEIHSSYQWKINADSILKEGEKVTLRCMAHFLVPDLERRATILIALKLKNDSVVTRYTVASQTGIYTTDITDDLALGIKDVYGLFVIHHPAMYSGSNTSSNSNNSQKKQIVAISQLKLLHEQKVIKKTGNKSFSTAQSDSAKVNNNDLQEQRISEQGLRPERKINADVEIATPKTPVSLKKDF